jgi:bacteriocin-like protein
MDGLLITHGGKRYFVRPELLELCHVSDSDLQELQKSKTLPKDPVVEVPSSARELSEKELSGVSGGITLTNVQVAQKIVEESTVMCPAW